MIRQRCPVRANTDLANTDPYRVTVACTCWGAHFRLAYTARHGEQLVQHLDDYIRLTEAVAPVRQRPYKPAETARAFRRAGETEWERALWDALPDSHPTTREFLPGVCGALVAYQTMLRHTDRDTGWAKWTCSASAPAR